MKVEVLSVIIKIINRTFKIYCVALLKTLMSLLIFMIHTTHIRKVTLSNFQSD